MYVLSPWLRASSHIQKTTIGSPVCLTISRHGRLLNAIADLGQHHCCGRYCVWYCLFSNVVLPLVVKVVLCLFTIIVVGMLVICAAFIVMVLWVYVRLQCEGFEYWKMKNIRRNTSCTLDVWFEKKDVCSGCYS